jgi:hypothetical protein
VERKTQVDRQAHQPSKVKDGVVDVLLYTQQGKPAVDD